MTLRQIIINVGSSKIIAVYSSDADQTVGIKQAVVGFGVLGGDIDASKATLLTYFASAPVIANVVACVDQTLIIT